MQTTLIKDTSTLLTILRGVPGNCLILLPDSPKFTIVEVSEEYNDATFTKREEIIGRGIFEVFPDDPHDPQADGVKNLGASLRTVIETKKIHEMAVQRYPVPIPGTDDFEEKYWLPVNKPLIIGNNVAYVIHCVEDITEKLSLRISEQHFRALADETSIMIWRCVNGYCTYVNKVWINFTGLSYEDSLGQGITKAIHPDDLARELDSYASARANNAVYESKYRVLRKDGEVRWVLTKASPHFFEGHKIEYIGSVIDITDQELAQQIISQREAHFRNMLQTLPQITWTNTVDGEASFYNQQWHDYTGLNFEQTKALELHNVVHPDDLQITQDQLLTIMLSGSGGEFENRYKRHDGVYRWHLNRMLPLKNEEGEVEMWIGTATDIQDLKQLQQQKDDFISIASHELKTPVTSLKATLQMLKRMKDKPLTSITFGLIDQANKSMEKISSLIEDLLNMSRMNEGQVHLIKRWFTLVKMIEDCCIDYRAAGRYAINISGDIELSVFADAERLGQVVVNFLNNALKYAAGSDEIFIVVEKKGDSALVSVSDSGPGIAADKLPHLFDRYYRADTSGMQYSGLGLGLYISSEIVKKHKGKIGVNSELGKGSTFWFSIPIDPDF